MKAKAVILIFLLSLMTALCCYGQDTLTAPTPPQYFEGWRIKNALRQMNLLQHCLKRQEAQADYTRLTRRNLDNTVDALDQEREISKTIASSQQQLIETYEKQLRQKDLIIRKQQRQKKMLMGGAVALVLLGLLL